MKYCTVATLLIALLGFSVPAHAVPLLPYAQPVAAQLDADIETLSAIPSPSAEESRQLRLFQSARKTFDRNSTALRTDINILNSLHRLLAELPPYDTLLATAANDYTTDFEGRRAEQFDLLVANAPLTSSYSFAFNTLSNIQQTLVRVRAATTTARQIVLLQNAANKLDTVPRHVQRAISARVTLSQVSVRGSVGVLPFKSGRGLVVGSFTNGVLNVIGFDPGKTPRGVQLHVENIDLNVARTYPLGTGGNTAIYVGTDIARDRDFFFHADPSLATEAVPSQLTIDAAKPGFITGRFSFVGRNLDTNQTSNLIATNVGTFQLNF